MKICILISLCIVERNYKRYKELIKYSMKAPSKLVNTYLMDLEVE